MLPTSQYHSRARPHGGVLLAAFLAASVAFDGVAQDQRAQIRAGGAAYQETADGTVRNYTWGALGMPGGVSRGGDDVAYHGHLGLTIPVCGDGRTARHREECDDGNNAVRDGCSPICEIEPPYPFLIGEEPCVRGEPSWACPGYAIGIVPDGSLSTALLDFSRSYDSDSMNPLRFIYAVESGDGWFGVDPEFANNEEDMGGRVLYFPRGDGPRTDRIRVTAIDNEGNTSVSIVDVTMPNTVPSILRIAYDAIPALHIPANDPNNPVVIEPKAHGGYRIILPVVPLDGTGIVVNYLLDEPANEELSVSADFTEDRLPDRADYGLDGRLELGIQAQPRGRRFEGNIHYVYMAEDFPGPDITMIRTLTMWAGDGDPGGLASRTAVMQIPPPGSIEAGEITYTIDVGADGAVETRDGPQPVAEFHVPAGASEVRVAGHMTVDGSRIPFDLGVIPLPNRPPVFTNARVISQDAYDVVIIASAVDPDGDPVTVSVDWDDGNEDGGRGVIYRHSYHNERFREYTIRLRAEDARGGVDTEELEVAIQPPEIEEIDLSGLAWRRVTPTEGLYDGIPTFAVDSAGTIFTHNYMDIIRRSNDEGATWENVLEDVECCGKITTRRAGEVFVASPGGLFFSSDNGLTWSAWSESKYRGVMLSADQNFVIAATDEELRRFDLTGRMVDVHDLPSPLEDLERCASGERAAFSTERGQLWINDRRDLAAEGWVMPDERFEKAGAATSVSFDQRCNLYQGHWNGYRVLRTNGQIIPASERLPDHLLHPNGSFARNVYGGAGYLADILAWADSAVLVAAERGVWGANEPWNAHRAPYWPQYMRGVDRSVQARQFAMHPTSGHVFLSTSSATETPRYCRRRVRRDRRQRRSRVRGQRAAVQFVYVYCGMRAHYYGGLYRSTTPLLESRTVGQGGSEFDLRYARGVGVDRQAGGLVVTIDADQPTDLWLVNTAESTISRWDPALDPPEEAGRYRVGLPAGECPGECCWADGCNMPSRVAIDSAGNAYVASRGFQFQGTVTKIAGNLNECIDRNNNGRIDTSRDAVALGYGEDECVLWTQPVGPRNTVLRALTIDIGDAQHPAGYVWVGGYNTRKLYKLNPATGEVLLDVDLEVQPYGALVTGTGQIYVSTLGEGRLQTVDSRTNAAGPVIANPDGLRDGCRSSYGLTLDSAGRIWLSGWDCPDAVAYNPEDASWCRVELPFGHQVGRGIAGDPRGRIWAAVGGDEQSHVAWWAGDLCEPGNSNRLPEAQLIRGPAGTRGPTAVGSDSAGKIWMAHHITPTLLRFDPSRGNEMTEFEGTNRVYSYSDFTGITRTMSLGLGTYDHEFRANCEAPTWTNFGWDASIPEGGLVTFSVQTADQRDKLDLAPLVRIAQVPADRSPMNVGAQLDAAGVEQQEYLRVRATLTLGAGGESPVLRQMVINWDCE